MKNLLSHERGDLETPPQLFCCGLQRVDAALQPDVTRWNESVSADTALSE